MATERLLGRMTRFIGLVGSGAVVCLLLAASPGGADDGEIRRLIEEAYQLYRDGFYLEAEIDCKKVLDQAPAFYPAHNLLGRIYAQREGRENEAIVYLTKSLELNADQFDVYNDLGYVLRDLGRLDEAIDCFKKGLLRYPRSFQLNFNLGVLYLMDKQDPYEAVDYFTAAEKERPDYDKVLYLLGLTKLAMAKRYAALEYVTKLRQAKNEYLAIQLENVIRSTDQGRSVDMGSMMKTYADQQRAKEPTIVKSAPPAQAPKAPVVAAGAGAGSGTVSGSGEITIETVITESEEPQPKKHPIETTEIGLSK